MGSGLDFQRSFNSRMNRLCTPCILKTIAPIPTLIILIKKEIMMSVLFVSPHIKNQFPNVESQDLTPLCLT